MKKLIIQLLYAEILRLKSKVKELDILNANLLQTNENSSLEHKYKVIKNESVVETGTFTDNFIYFKELKKENNELIQKSALLEKAFSSQYKMAEGIDTHQKGVIDELHKMLTFEQNRNNNIESENEMLKTENERLERIGEIKSKENEHLLDFINNTPQWKNSVKDGLPVLKLGENILIKYVDDNTEYSQWYEYLYTHDQIHFDDKEFYYFIIPQNATN